MKVGTPAVCTVTVFGVATAAAAIATATAVSTVAMVSFGLLTMACSAASIAAITAWVSPHSKDATSYFETMQAHFKNAFAFVVQFVGQTLATAVVDGVAQGIRGRVARKFG